ncbi:MAG: efflux RND transporter periplasmic adaptor subunit [Tannerellaceae bacterium]|jgi:membrane fusion protein (multidrug efflux system)|nr:efflux RND transporter periplasmic adaptor subunit [Tannerellaceae bacterium]
MTKKAKWSVIVLIGLFIAGMIVYPKIKREMTVSKSVAEAPPPAAVARTQVLIIQAEVIKPQSLTDKIISTGSTIPDEEVDLSFESSGKIIAIYFKEGTHVKEGDLLAKINDKPLQAQLKKLEAEVPLATDRVYRQRTLLEKDAVSQEAFEQVTTEYEKLMADIELVKANIAQTELRAPFDGVIGLRSVSEGAYATPSTQIVKLTRISPIKIEFSIPENYAADVADGTSIVFRMEGANGLMHDYRATVYAVESKVDMETRTLRVRATYPNTNETIQPGRYLSVEVTKREIKDALAVPSEAIIPEMGKSIIYLYKGGEAYPQEIITGLRTESRVQVLDGVQAGDTVITTGVMQLRTGMKVDIDNLNK